MLEISVYKDNVKTLDYKKLDKKQGRKLYNIAILGLAVLDLNALKNGAIVFSSSLFGLPNWLMLAFLAVMIIIAYVSSIIKNKELTLESLLKELLWILLALAPGVLAFLLFKINIPFYI